MRRIYPRNFYEKHYIRTWTYFVRTESLEKIIFENVLNSSESRPKKGHVDYEKGGK